MTGDDEACPEEDKPVAADTGKSACADPEPMETSEKVDAPRITLRVLAGGEGSEDQKFWLDRLKEGGAEIVSASGSGIVAEGPVTALEKALDVTVEMDNGEPTLREETAIRSSDEADPPVAYIPRKPTMFP